MPGRAAATMADDCAATTRMITPPRTAAAARRVTARRRPVLIKAISNARNIHLRLARFCATLRSAGRARMRRCPAAWFF